MINAGAILILSLKCTLLANGNVKTLEVPVHDAMATINATHNGFQFEATVFEERMNSVRISHPGSESETMSYSPSDYTLRTLTTNLKIKDSYASVDCEVVSK